MTEKDMTIRETTQAAISGCLVGVGNIWERELADDKGETANRMSASLSITDVTSRETHVIKVFAGGAFTVGADRYYVVDVREGEKAPGSITIRKLPS